MKRFVLLFSACSLLCFSMVHAAILATSLSAVRVYPNPWRSDKNANALIKFDNVPPRSVVKIFTVAAEEVKAISADSSGLALWDATNGEGSRVASGVYIYLVIDPQGNETSGKLAIIR